MWHYCEQQVVRTVIALCTLAGISEGQDVRDDMRDEASTLIHLWLGVSGMSANDASPSALLLSWCGRLAQRLDALAEEANQPMGAILAAHTAVLRLRATVGVSSVDQRAPVVPRPAPVPERTNRISKKTMGYSERVRTPGKNQAKVFDAIRDRPNMRTKGLVEHFSGVLSARTVKRCLRDLAAAGSISRVRSKDGGVTYVVDMHE